MNDLELKVFNQLYDKIEQLEQTNRNSYKEQSNSLVELKQYMKNVEQIVLKR